MLTKIVELTNGFNWGKFMLARFDGEEWRRRSEVDVAPVPIGRGLGFGVPLLQQVGWNHRHVWVLDLQTGEGACFLPGGNARADLEKHAIWVCPMFEVFLGWFYARRELWTDITSVPDLITLTDEETMSMSSLYGHRRPGPGGGKQEGEAP